MHHATSLVKQCFQILGEDVQTGLWKLKEFSIYLNISENIFVMRSNINDITLGIIAYAISIKLS